VGEGAREPAARNAGREPDLLFYDGGCGLCHRSVRFVAPRDPDGHFRFAPLGGETFIALVPPDARGTLPDSVVVRRRDGALLVRSDAVLHILRRLGGGWRALAAVLSLVPRALRDAGYDWLARNRARWFARPDEACPIVPAHLRARFAP
jgi:predicted DCC family thiol-disulfide oxidoreductase YuxK